MAEGEKSIGWVIIVVTLASVMCSGCERPNVSHPIPHDEYGNYVDDVTWKVDTCISSILRDHDPSTRKAAIVRAGRLSNVPEMTPELRKRLIEALQQLLAMEHDEDTRKEATKSLEILQAR